MSVDRQWTKSHEYASTTKGNAIMPDASETEIFVARFEEWCKARNLKTGYVTRVALNNSRATRSLLNDAKKAQDTIAKLRTYMAKREMDEARAAAER